MFYFKMIIRFILGIGAVLYVIALLFQIFHNNLHYEVIYICAMYFLFVEFPATILFLLVSAYSYLSNRIFWSLFKIEYYFLIANLTTYSFISLIFLIFPGIDK